jgi:anti-sigma regulatory factor (Ser/Thr protein kinase)
MPYYRCPACGLTAYSAAGHWRASACPSCSAELPDSAKLYVSPECDRGTTRALAARPEAAADARRAVAALALPTASRETLALIVSELVTNSVRHAGLGSEEPVRMHISDRADHMRLVVRDGGQGFTPSSVESPDPLAPGGLGLVLVSALSEEWGVECDAAGCTVWCDVAIEEERAA